jgi:two-component system, OmpR family, response regulator
MRGLALAQPDDDGHGREGPAPSLFAAGDVVLDEINCSVSIRGHRIALSTAHVKLLAYFMRHANTVVTREALAADLWSGKRIDPRSIDVAIVRLRQALQEDELGRVIRTVHSEGYEFVGVPERFRPRGARARGRTVRDEVKA